MQTYHLLIHGLYPIQAYTKPHFGGAFVDEDAASCVACGVWLLCPTYPYGLSVIIACHFERLSPGHVSKGVYQCLLRYVEADDAVYNNLSCIS